MLIFAGYLLDIKEFFLNEKRAKRCIFGRYTQYFLSNFDAVFFLECIYCAESIL
jgi:hypothetical protein